MRAHWQLCRRFRALRCSGAQHPLKHLAPSFELPGTGWYSFQRGASAEVAVYPLFLTAGVGKGPFEVEGFPPLRDASFLVDVADEARLRGRLEMIGQMVLTGF